VPGGDDCPLPTGHWHATLTHRSPAPIHAGSNQYESMSPRRSPFLSYLRRSFCSSTTVSCKASRMSQPPWAQPTGSTHEPHLKIYNSLTKSKVPFVPIQPEHISWYACGPTVYDDAHLGHARNYVSTDIIRRILRDYFHFNIKFIMNTTDVDDKIILRGRQRHLYDEYKKQHRYCLKSLHSQTTF
jgi:hypothetical protein